MTENLTRTEALERSARITISTYDVTIDVSEAPFLPTFRTSSRIALTSETDGPLWFDFIGESVHSVVLDGEAVPFAYDGARVTLEMPAGEHVVEVAATAVYSRSGEGLHTFTDPLDGEVYLYSQFEPADARRVFVNCEQPNLKARFRISITAPAAWTVLSNGVETSRTPAPPNSAGTECARVDFAETKPMSTYITAFVAGPYAGVTDSYVSGDQRIDLGLYCRKTLLEHFDVEDIFAVTKSGLDTFQEAFESEYPWGKYDQVFVPEYNLGAMENPGCVTFTEKYIFRGANTYEKRAKRANTILHEMSHMWFGDLVTMEWWDDLWLKESFAEFMGAWASVRGGVYTDAWTSFAGARLDWALTNDQFPTTHPIVADITDLEAADQNFDGITYAKGAAVLRQLVALVGEDAFFRGARRYFADNAFGNATLHELVDALEWETGRDILIWTDAWLDTSRPTTIAVSRTESGAILAQIPAEPAAMVRPNKLLVSAFAEENGKLVRVGQFPVELTETAEVSWEALGVSGSTDVALILPNDEALTYAKIRFDEVSLAAALATPVADELSRAVVETALWHGVRDAEIAPDAYVRHVLTSGEQNGALVASMANRTGLALLRFTPPETRPVLAWEFLPAILDAALAAEPGTDVQVAWTTLFARLAHLGDTAAGTARLLETVTDPDLRWALLTARAATGTATAEELDAELAATGSASDVAHHLRAMSARPGGRAEVLDRIINESPISNESLQALVDGFAHPAGAPEAREALAARGGYLDVVERAWGSRSMELAERIAYGLYPMSDLGGLLGANPELAEVTSWLAATSSEIESATDQGGSEGKRQVPTSLRKVVLDLSDEHSRVLMAQLRWNPEI